MLRSDIRIKFDLDRAVCRSVLHLDDGDLGVGNRCQHLSLLSGDLHMAFGTFAFVESPHDSEQG